jgi:5'-3' exonuclease
MNIYMKSVPKFNDYLTDNGTLKIKLLEIILTEFGKMEDEIFKNRHKVSEPEPNSFQTNVQAKTAFDVNKYVRFN